MERVQQELKIELKHTQLDDLQIPSSPYFPAYDYAYDYAYEQGHGQGSPPMVQECFQSVISQLFQHTPKTIICCGGAVDDDMANIIVAQLLYLETSFAWLELMSHKSFIPKLLIINPPKGWPHVQRLLVGLFKFMEPYPRSAELGETGGKNSFSIQRHSEGVACAAS